MVGCFLINVVLAVFGIFRKTLVVYHDIYIKGFLIDLEAMFPHKGAIQKWGRPDKYNNLEN